MSIEEWRPVVGFPDYEVSNTGRIMSTRPWNSGTRRPHEIHGSVDNYGYRALTLVSAEGRHLRVRVHRLVAQAFYGPPAPGQQVRHLDGDRLNNRVENLAWGTQSENERDKVRHGTHQQARKTHCPQGHPYDETNTRTRRDGGRINRHCRTCLRQREQSRVRSDRRRAS